ncbi:SGNH/GDSL hydrolase family protein [Rugosimonospora africana]|uniref:Lipase 1 n=1 Tax=Rugosimonospora africana TaxID=556532 RepID=A0A8J3R373_9ACTN|nr:SGNH/GDSL hydrolase family protein [Rugosimonospora africana]GIH20858.1 lipase 1 [Rugosimonospora africana]
MRSTRLVTLAIGVAAATAAALAMAAPAQAASAVRYVALGDSYSSGVGAGSYISSSGSCDRSTNAYSALWAAAHAPAAYTSVACSGATTSTVNNSQLSALSSTTTLVSVTVGGNDVGFSNIMETCALQGTDACVSAVQSAESVAQSTLPGLLNTTYNNIRAHAPNAKVVVLDYPVFYQLGTVCVGLSATSHAKIDEGINLLDGILSTAASQHGFTFGDVRSVFVGHQLCGSGTNWLHALNFLDITESYHPTASGQSGGYLPVFTAAAG